MTGTGRPGGGRGDRSGEVVVQFAVRTAGSLGSQHDEVCPGGQAAGGPVEVAGRRPETPAQPVADDRGADLASDGEGDAHLTGAG